MTLRLNEVKVVGKNKIIQIKEVTNTGVVHRRTLAPNATFAEDEHQEVKDLAESEWTDEVKATYDAWDRARVEENHEKWID